MTYAELTLPRGKGYSQLVPRSQASALYAEIDHARNRSLPRGGGSCFPRSLDWQEEVTSQTPLVGSETKGPRPQYVVWKGAGPRAERSPRESNV